MKKETYVDFLRKVTSLTSKTQGLSEEERHEKFHSFIRVQFDSIYMHVAESQFWEFHTGKSADGRTILDDFADLMVSLSNNDYETLEKFLREVRMYKGYIPDVVEKIRKRMDTKRPAI